MAVKTSDTKDIRPPEQEETRMHMNADDFYSQHLNRVSRSFAFCIQELDQPLREWVGCTYLICRMLDTIEDAPWSDKPAQLDCFSQFDSFLTSPENVEQEMNWARLFPTNLDQGEKALLNDAPVVFHRLSKFPKQVLASIQATVHSMSAGMQRFVKVQTKSSLHLANLQQVNQYCFFVAGVVGEALAKLVSIAKPEYKVSHQELVDAYHFGLFLQKVNLLKDQQHDESVGRYLVPSRGQLLFSLQTHANAAFRYISNIPSTIRSYRLFCAWSFFIGLASLPWIEQAYLKRDKTIKIPRAQTLLLVEKIKRVVNHDDKLDKLFAQLNQPLKNVTSHSRSAGDGESIDWIHAAYRGELKQEHLTALGL